MHMSGDETENPTMSTFKRRCLEQHPSEMSDTKLRKFLEALAAYNFGVATLCLLCQTLLATATDAATDVH